MIRKVTLRRFKRFEEVTFDLLDNIVLAGPNNTGKTTLLQAVAAWELSLRYWRELNDTRKHRGGYAKKPVARQAFTAVPLRTFDLLWRDRVHQRSIEIELHGAAGWRVCVEIIPDSTEQVYVRPTSDTNIDHIRACTFAVAFISSMTGLSVEEPVLQLPRIEQLLGMARPGEVLRNLLLQASASEASWSALTASINDLFGYELVHPDGTGPSIMAAYRERAGGPLLDVTSAGSGFLQVLLLLTFLNTRTGAVLLLDEPDAHLHVILQDAIYGELRTVARRQNSQLIVATHSEVVINSVEPRHMIAMVGTPRALATTEDRARLLRSLKVISNTDVMLALGAPGILFTEDYTDLLILREWARILAHPAHAILTTGLFWKPTVWQAREGARGASSRDVYAALALVREDLPALEIVDGDARAEIQSSEIAGQGFQRIRWRRYEIESYLLHPEALKRFVRSLALPGGGDQAARDIDQYFERNYPPGFAQAPHEDIQMVLSTKARTSLIPPALAAGGLPGYDYTEYWRIAAIMTPEEIHPDVRAMLDTIVRAFNR